MYVLESRARYKSFVYNMTINSVITVLDKRLGFKDIAEIKDKIHQKLIGYCTFYVIDAPTQVYVLQRFKKTQVDVQMTLAKYLCNNPTTNRTKIFKDILESML
jgi:hypothetical protein